MAIIIISLLKFLILIFSFHNSFKLLFFSIFIIIWKYNMSLIFYIFLLPISLFHSFFIYLFSFLKLYKYNIKQQNFSQWQLFYHLNIFTLNFEKFILSLIYLFVKLLLLLLFCYCYCYCYCFIEILLLNYYWIYY